MRALINIVDLGNNAVILDPMCGSGTTLVEARLSGKNCYGLDMNPLSAYISKVKCEALSLKPSDLVAALDALREALDGQLKPGSGCSTFLSSKRPQLYETLVRSPSPARIGPNKGSNTQAAID